MLREWRKALGHDRDVMPATVELSCTVQVGRFTFTTHQDKLPPKLVQSVLGVKRMNRKRTEKPAPALLSLTRFRRGDGQRAAYDAAMRTGRWAA